LVRRSRRAVAALIVSTVLAFAGPAEALQCVPFAREVSGIGLRGDAWTWWGAAAGQYERGQAPHLGAVVVFKKYGSMRHGHVAVVTGMLGSRMVLVEHANWAPHRSRERGKVSQKVAVMDVSPANDWTEVRVWNDDSQDFGTRTYPTYGFIYPHKSPSHFQQAAFVLPQEVTVSSTLWHAPVPSPTKSAEAKTGEAKPVASNPDGQTADIGKTESSVETAKARPAAPAPVAAPAPLASAESVWEDDALEAKRFGSGRYGR
jgi:surface antigen